MNRRAASVVALTLLAGCEEPSASASCAGPQVVAAPSTFAPGEEVQVGAGGLFDDCHDTGQPGTPPATQDVEFRLVTSGDDPRTFVLATVDANEDGTVDTAVRIPDDVPPGPARIEAAHGAPVVVEVTVPVAP